MSSQGSAHGHSQEFGFGVLRSKKSNESRGRYPSADAKFSKQLPRSLKHRANIWGLETDFQALEIIIYLNCICVVKRKSLRGCNYVALGQSYQICRIFF